MPMSPTKHRVPKRYRATLRFSKHAVIILILFGIYSFVNVWQNVSIAYLNRQNEQLREELTDLNQQCDILTFEAEQLKAPDRIKQVLQEHMTLVPAEKINIHQIP